MKRILWGSLIVLLLAACGTSKPDLPQATNTFNFTVNPAAQSVELASTPAAGLTAQAEDGSRVLKPATELSLESFTFTFLPGNLLAIDAVFKNVSDQTFTNLTFSRAAGSDDIVSSTEPNVVATLAPGASTGTLRFTVQHRGQPFTYAVEARATVGMTGGAGCTDPVNIPDRFLKEGTRIQLQLQDSEITCADMERLTELDIYELRDDIDEEFPELVDVGTLEGLQFAVNLEFLALPINSNNKDLLQPLTGLTSLTKLRIGLSGGRLDNIDIPEEFENFYNFSYLGSLINLTDLRLFAYQTDYSWISSLTKLTTLDLSFNELIEDLTPFSTLTNLTDFNLSTNSVSELGPLVSNPGIGEGDDRLDLDQNCLVLTPGSEDLEAVNTLESRNPDVQNVFLGTQKKDAFCGRTPDSGADLSLFVNAFKRGDDGFGTVDTVQVGDVVEFVVTIDNNGPDTAFDIVVTAEVDNAAGLESFTFEAVADSNCDTVLDGPETYKLVCTLTEALPAGGEVGQVDPRFFLGFAAEADNVGTMTARFEVSSNTTNDFDSSNNDDVKEISVLPENSGDECTDPVNIPDDTLRQSIRDALNKPEGDITCADMASLTELVSRIENEVDLEQIGNLEGIQFAKNLETLDFFVSCCEVVPDFFEPLSGLANLTTLKIFNIRDFQELDFDDLDFSPLGSLSNLTVLSLPETQVSNIDFLSGLTNLSTLDLSDNVIDDYSPLSNLTALKKLDLSSDRLYLEFFGVEDIGFLSGLTALTDLDLSSNNVSDLSPLSGLTQLVNLDLSSNLVTDISPLVINEGIGDGDDELVLVSNCLDTSSGSQALGDADTLESRNPDVQNVFLGMQGDDEACSQEN